MKPSNITTSRFGSLDMLRGIAIAGMVVVNNPGSWLHMYPWLRHAGWIGYGLADLVFPFFLFALGAAQSFSLAGAAHTGRLPAPLLMKILRRALILFLLGLFLNALPTLLKGVIYGAAYDFSHFRICGVLQRIAIVYFAASLCIVFLPKRLLWPAIALLLLGYWAILASFPGSLTPVNNPALFIDRLLLGANHLYKGGLDPEGLFSSVSALATVLLGYAAGAFLRQAKGARSGSVKLFTAGILGIAAGSLWGQWLPVCKDLYTGSYALATAGWAALVFALCHEVLEKQGLRRLALPFQVLGRNALFLFVATAIEARILLALTANSGGRQVQLWARLYDLFFASWLGATELSSLAFAAAYLGSWWLILYCMDRKGWYIKV